MSNRGRPGQAGEPVSQQDILKVFDFEENRVMTAHAITDALHKHFGVATSAAIVFDTLQTMAEEEIVQRIDYERRDTGWRSTVAPELADDVSERVADRSDADLDEFVEL